MKKRQLKLDLAKETLRTLATVDGDMAQGGATSICYRSACGTCATCVNQATCNTCSQFLSCGCGSVTCD